MWTHRYLFFWLKSDTILYFVTQIVSALTIETLSGWCLSSFNVVFLCQLFCFEYLFLFLAFKVYLSALTQKSFLQRIMAPIVGESYSETSIWALAVLLAAQVSQTLGLLREHLEKNAYILTWVYTHTSSSKPESCGSLHSLFADV